jgi:hypothetical protein
MFNEKNQEAILGIQRKPGKKTTSIVYFLKIKLKYFFLFYFLLTIVFELATMTTNPVSPQPDLAFAYSFTYLTTAV